MIQPVFVHKDPSSAIFVYDATGMHPQDLVSWLQGNLPNRFKLKYDKVYTFRSFGERVAFREGLEAALGHKEMRA